MYKILAGSTSNLPDTAGFIELLDRGPGFAQDSQQKFFESQRELVVTRAPGRLDLMGGIADYSGSLVLELPIANGTHVALQLQEARLLNIASLPAASDSSTRAFEMPLADFEVGDQPIEYGAARGYFNRDPAHRWAAYVAGVFLVLMRERGETFSLGARILISSTVPEGKGVSSSAALEVATMQAVASAYQMEVPPQEMAFLCQQVENRVAGAPCGVMDQMTAACGEAGELLALLCQPGELRGTVKLPKELAVWGIDSGIRHAVGGADYTTVRTAAFMGYRMIADMAGLPCHETGTAGVVQVKDDRWDGYLANISPEEFERSYAHRFPEQIVGQEFLRRYGGITDSVTTVDPKRSYPVLAATRHPIYEHARVKSFAATLENWQGLNQAESLGELMYESHESYSACGLGSAGTDELVRLVRELGVTGGLFGARITGGGSGGTVAILGRRGASDAVEEIKQEYALCTGYSPTLFSSSSPGASAFGYLRLMKETCQNHLR